VYDAIVIGGRCAGAVTAILLARNCSAFRDADFLASAVHDELTGQTPLNEALTTYGRRRNYATLAEYRENIAWARFSPMPTEILELRQAVRGNQHDTSHFIMALEGMIPREEFFNPENLERIHSGSDAAVAARDSSCPFSTRET
jgi:hypothetical protein